MRGIAYCGDLRDVLGDIPPGTFSSCATDPPYHLKGKSGKGGFMGRAWDGGDVAFRPETWEEVYRVLKPGAYLVAFGGTRTEHRMTCAIEDAGFVIRDKLAWLYGQGMPKGLNIAAALGDDGDEWDGWGTTLKPAYEPIVLAQKPAEEWRGGPLLSFAECVRKHGTGALNVGACRIGEAGGCRSSIAYVGGPAGDVFGRGLNDQRSDPVDGLGRWPANVILDGAAAELLDEQSGVMRGGKMPAYRSGMGFKEGAAGTVGEGRTLDDGGASRLFLRADYDADDLELVRFLYHAKATRTERDAGLADFPLVNGGGMSGTADGSLLTGSGNVRNNLMRNNHPTVKPTRLMRWLVRLITPPGGTVVDPFTGSGSTGVACAPEGFGFFGSELLVEHHAIAQARLSHAYAHYR